MQEEKVQQNFGDFLQILSRFLAYLARMFLVSS